MHLSTLSPCSEVFLPWGAGTGWELYQKLHMFTPVHSNEDAVPRRVSQVQDPQPSGLSASAPGRCPRGFPAKTSLPRAFSLRPRPGKYGGADTPPEARNAAVNISETSTDVTARHTPLAIDEVLDMALELVRERRVF